MFPIYIQSYVQYFSNTFVLKHLKITISHLPAKQDLLLLTGKIVDINVT